MRAFPTRVVLGKIPSADVPKGQLVKNLIWPVVALVAVWFLVHFSVIEKTTRERIEELVAWVCVAALGAKLALWVCLESTLIQRKSDTR